MRKETFYKKAVFTKRNWDQIALEAIGAVTISLLAAQVVLHSLVPHLTLR